MKGKNLRKKKLIKRGLIVSILAFIFVVVGYCLFQEELKSVDKVKAYDVVGNPGGFRLSAHNRWDNSDDKLKSYAQLDWDEQDNLTQQGYKLYQSKDGINWNTRSLHYGKSIRVLNVYPDVDESNTLQGWMNGLNLTADDNVTNLIQVTPVSITEYNADPNEHLRENGTGDYQYDVIMFGSWDNNNHEDISTNAAAATVEFIDTGRGVLFGHDTIYKRPNIENWYDYFSGYLGLGHEVDMESGLGYISGEYLSGSRHVEIINDGYLMKYPFELPNNTILDIPYSHSTELSLKGIGTIWAEFDQVTGEFPNEIYDDDTYRGGWYLKTNENTAMIQTGHSQGASSLDERRIIANVLYNLAQVSLENNAQDQTVKDEQAPEVPGATIRCGRDGNINIKLDAVDRGTDYQFYVTADTRDQGLLTSDVVNETITSNIAGYFYEISESDVSTLAATVEGYKDENGRILRERYNDQNEIKGIYVAPTDPTDHSLEYETATTFNLAESNASERYLHVVAIDRANNISAVSSQQIRDITQPVDFEVERTADEARLVEVAIDNSIGDRMKSVEIQIPRNTGINDFDSLNLPTDWYSFENSETTDYYSFSFAMEDNNSVATIQTFLEGLRFTINDPVNTAGSIKVILHEEVYTFWEDSSGDRHYYAFIPEMETWLEAYNRAKTMSYRGLTGYLATLTSEEEHDFVYNNIGRTYGWLGGTRLRMTTPSAKRIDDESYISSNIGHYTYATDTATDWYWANGPEKGTVFFDRPTYDEGGNSPDGVYNGFNNPANNLGTIRLEPSNSASNENVLQFAQASETKYWNDISYNSTEVEGYYVEFSEYGGQTEGEEVTDVCWNAAIPQKIILQGYTERFGQTQRFNRGDIVYDQQLRIGNEITVQPNDFELYEFLELRARIGDLVMGPLPLDVPYTVTNALQEGALIYENRQVMLHVRQVVLEPNDQLINPEEGYLNLKTSIFDSSSHTYTEDISQLIQTRIPSQETEEVPDFETFVVSTKHMTDQQDQLILDLVLPEFYEYLGNFWTPRHFEDPNDPMGVDHQNRTENDLYGGNIVLFRDAIDIDREYFVTLYIRPTTAGQSPQPYSWDYKHNDLGEIKTE